jgi:hypothetical protein
LKISDNTIAARLLSPKMPYYDSFSLEFPQKAARRSIASQNAKES